MKKSMIALAVLASMAAHADNTTLYGRITMAYTYDDGGKGQSTSSFGDNGSRFGIKGSDDLGNGMSAFYKYENRFGKGHATTKRAYVGLKGGFGALSFGAQTLPTDAIEAYDDPFNALTPKAGAGFQGKTDSTQSVVYWTPDMSGFKLGVGLEANGKHEVYKSTSVKDAAMHGNTLDAAHVDYINIAATYQANGIMAGLGYETSNGLTENHGKDDADVDIITAALGYGNDVFEIGVEAEFRDEGKDDVTNARIAGLYKVTPMDSVYLGFANEFKDLDDADDGWSAAVGYQHKLSKRTRMWAEYSFRDSGAKENGENNLLNIGLRTDF